MSGDSNDKEIARIKALSDRVIGEPEEIDVSEGEELLKTAGIDPARLRENLYQRILERSAVYSRSGKPVPPILRKAQEDLRPSQAVHESSFSVAETARRHVRQLLQRIETLTKLLEMCGTPTFMAAYRKRADLSAGDKETLDNIAEDLRRKLAK